MKYLLIIATQRRHNSLSDRECVDAAAPHWVVHLQMSGAIWTNTNKGIHNIHGVLLSI